MDALISSSATGLASKTDDRHSRRGEAEEGEKEKKRKEHYRKEPRSWCSWRRGGDRSTSTDVTELTLDRGFSR